MNHFDRVYYINLPHRKDRLEHIQAQLASMDVDPDKIVRVEGVYMKGFGPLGCSKSHILALEHFLASPPENRTCVIFEDDFQLNIPPSQVNDILTSVFRDLEHFDVLMLSANVQREEPCPFPFLFKTLNAQTTSGYAVSRDFAPTLLENYREGAKRMEKAGRKVEALCLDMYMKRLQPVSTWYHVKPRIGKQMQSFSDIENRVVNYGV